MRGWIEKPQQQWLRKAMFQVHLWVGVALGLYIGLIGITGSALVFRDEMEHGLHAGATNHDPKEANLVEIAAKLRAKYPDRTLSSIRNPNEEDTNVRAFMRKGEESIAVLVDPKTGAMREDDAAGAGFLRWLQLLHFNLLMGRTGRILNGVGALFLLSLCVSGLVVWWPGIKNWKRGLKVDFSKSWKRFNWDSHSAVGFWSLAVLSMWAVTGAYFAWPTEFRAVVNWFSPVSLAQVPKPKGKAKDKVPVADVAKVMADARQRTPGGYLLSMTFPADARSHIRVFLGRENTHNFEQADYHYFDPFTGQHAGVWRRGLNPSAGDTVMAWIGPLHFGTFGGHGMVGIAVKLLWMLLGLAPPILMGTGFLMYWNRYLGKRWKEISKPVRVPALPQVEVSH